MADRTRHRRGFTLIELSLVIIILGVLAAARLGAAGRAVRSARLAGERQFLVSLAMGVEQFKTQFGFLPPLVQDGPPTTLAMGPVLPVTPRRPAVRPDGFLRYSGLLNEPRYSEYSLSYYIMGMLDIPDEAPGGAKPIDGVAGPGFTRPEIDGTFSQRGPTIQPFVDPAKGRNRVYRDPAAPEKVKITDRWGNAIRFYRWLPRMETTNQQLKGEVRQYNVPRAGGDPNTNQSLRGAEYAIVSIGPDNQTDDRRPLPTAGRSDPAVDAAPLDETVKDDIVEVGR